MPHKAGPEWKLDRRDSGRLFWRRDSNTATLLDGHLSPSPTATPSPSMDRVKFRYDVEVLEFWESDASDASGASDDDAADDDDDDGGGGGGDVFDDASRRRRRRPGGLATRETSLGQSLFVCVLCVGVLVGTIVLQWWKEQ